MDGIDAALVDFAATSLEVIAVHEHEYPSGLRERLLTARADAGICSAGDVPALHREVGECFRNAATALLDTAGASAATIAAIGSHGQTIRHEPELDEPFSLQVGDPEIIANGTGITTVADFRSADIALGGQGAPLAPAFHEWLFRRAGTRRAVVNLGGIGNVTLLPADNSDTTGFDTGPANTLLDAWCVAHDAGDYDHNGTWAAQGTVNRELLDRLRSDPYFAARPPKSTGFEYFNLGWLHAFDVDDLNPADVQATLAALSATTIADAVRETADEVLVCGGGVHNVDLMARLADSLPGIPVATTASAGLDPDWVEAAAFAWLAMRTIHGLPGNLPSVTGARGNAVLGNIHLPA